MNDIKHTKEYKDFLDYTTKTSKENNIKTKELYNKDNHNKYFISIDIKEANFTSFNYVNEDILKANTYKEFMSNYTDYDYIINSKYIRQVIFGNLNPKKQQKIQKEMIAKIYNFIKNDLNYEGGVFDIFSYTSDEIVFEVDRTSFNKLLNITNVLGTLPFYDSINIQLFKLNNFYKEYYVREYIDDKGIYKREFKKCPSTIFPQLYKKYYNIEIDEIDRKFYYENQICTFDKSI